jgi:hypothetical protein
MYSSETAPHLAQARLLRGTLFATSIVTMMYFAPQLGQSNVIGSGLLGRQLARAFVH